MLYATAASRASANLTSLSSSHATAPRLNRVRDHGLWQTHHLLRAALWNRDPLYHQIVCFLVISFAHESQNADHLAVPPVMHRDPVMRRDLVMRHDLAIHRDRVMRHDLAMRRDRVMRHDLVIHRDRVTCACCHRFACCQSS